MSELTNKLDVTSDDSTGTRPTTRSLVDPLARILIRIGILREDLDYHLIRAAMVTIFLFFGYQKWWAYEAQRLIPYISNGSLIFWLYPVFGVPGASWFLVPHRLRRTASMKPTVSSRGAARRRGNPGATDPPNEIASLRSQ
jgi:hypothetical protein